MLDGSPIQQPVNPAGSEGIMYQAFVQSPDLSINFTGRISYDHSTTRYLLPVVLDPDGNPVSTLGVRVVCEDGVPGQVVFDLRRAGYDACARG